MLKCVKYYTRIHHEIFEELINDDVELFKWLMVKTKNKSMTNYESLMVQCCIKGSLEMFKLLQTYKTNKKSKINLYNRMSIMDFNLKIYEYINLELPMIGALPEGDGMEIVNDNGYGVACKYNDLDGLLVAIDKFTDRNYLNSIKQNLINDKELWNMRSRIKEVDFLLRGLVD